MQVSRMCVETLFKKYQTYLFIIYGGERGIRTLGSIATTHAFQAC